MYSLISRKILILIVLLTVSSILLIGRLFITPHQPLNVSYGFLGAYAYWNITIYDKNVLYRLNASRVSMIHGFEIAPAMKRDVAFIIRLILKRLSITYPNGTMIIYNDYSEVWKAISEERLQIPPFIIFYEFECSSSEDIRFVVPWFPPNRLGEEVIDDYKFIRVESVDTPLGIFLTYVYKTPERDYFYFDAKTGLLVKSYSSGELRYRNTTFTIISTNIIK